MNTLTKNIITLQRSYLPDNQAAIGKLTLPNGWSCMTIERPWLDNQRKVSCIPEGVYAMKWRPSPLVTRLSKGKHTSAWEAADVINRSDILIHQGNYVRHSEGCILVGKDHSKNGEEWMVTSSVVTYDRFIQEMKAMLLACNDTPHIDIRGNTVGWP